MFTSELLAGHVVTSCSALLQHCSISQKLGTYKHRSFQVVHSTETSDGMVQSGRTHMAVQPTVAASCNNPQHPQQYSYSEVSTRQYAGSTSYIVQLTMTSNQNSWVLTASHHSTACMLYISVQYNRCTSQVKRRSTPVRYITSQEA
jgi:hypothetical protein